MGKKLLTPEQEERVKRILRSKIIKLREAAFPTRPEDDEDDIDLEDPEAPPANAPVNAPVNTAPVNAPANAAPKNAPANVPPANVPANRPKNVPVNAPVNAAPTNSPKNLPVSSPAPSDMDMPDDVTNPAGEAPDAVDSEQSKIRQAKVKIFFDKLRSNPTIMNYLNFTSPLEQAEAIIQFAEMTNVPRTQLLPLLQQIRTLSQQPKNAPANESVKKKSTRK